MIFREKVNISLLIYLPLVIENKFTWADVLATSSLAPNRTSPFVNGYFQDINKPWLDHHLFLVFESKPDELFKLPDFKKYDMFCDLYSYRIQNTFYNVVVFEIPRHYSREMDLVLAGRYTMLPEETKTIITSFWRATDSQSIYLALHSKNKEVFGLISDEFIGECDNIEDPLIDIMENRDKPLFESYFKVE